MFSVFFCNDFLYAAFFLPEMVLMFGIVHVLHFKHKFEVYLSILLEYFCYFYSTTSKSKSIMISMDRGFIGPQWKIPTLPSSM